jgi:hypothetical protein
MNPDRPVTAYDYSSVPTIPTGKVIVPPHGVTLAYDSDFPRSLVAVGRLEGLSILSVVLILSECGTDKIAQCLECSGFFFKVRITQKYCSKTCINRVSQREWRKKPENREKESTSAHRRYKRRVQQCRKVKVERRPNNKSKGKE